MIKNDVFDEKNWFLEEKPPIIPDYLGISIEYNGDGTCNLIAIPKWFGKPIFRISCDNSGGYF